MTGVIAALALYFTLHVLFTGWATGARWPDWSSLSRPALGLTALAALLLAGLRLPLPAALALMALAGWLVTFV